MNIKISIQSESGNILACHQDEGCAQLHYQSAYNEGDSICLQCDEPCMIYAQLDDALPAGIYYLSAPFSLKVPFGEKKTGHSPKSFSGNNHLLYARQAMDFEISLYRNVALNPLDSHTNSTLFPHAIANVETRGEAVFAARNAINGGTATFGHGPWPYESWGINRQDDAELKLDFGREVNIDRLVLTLRADFPHDNWWQKATVEFSDGSQEILSFKKSGSPQAFKISERKISWLKVFNLVKCADDPSPFPALTQIEVWGR